MEKDDNIDNKNQKSDNTNFTSTKQYKKEKTDKENTLKNEEVKKIPPEDKIKELEDKLARTLAEMENQRRRFEKERDDAFDYGGFSFAKETLNLIDNLERSKQILTNDVDLKDSIALKKTLEHFEIINKDMVSILSKNGITAIESMGKKLDPNLHQAMMEIEDDDKEPSTIIQEIQKGFMMKDRLLRPALVGVSKKIENKDQKSEQNKEKKDSK